MHLVPRTTLARKMYLIIYEYFKRILNAIQLRAQSGPLSNA